jgi:hypothetical protein
LRSITAKSKPAALRALTNSGKNDDEFMTPMLLNNIAINALGTKCIHEYIDIFTYKKT